MKWRMILFVCLLVFLTGCAGRIMGEKVTDEVVETFSAESELYRIHLYIPEEMVQQPKSPAVNGTRYLHRDGTAAISTGNLRATSAENAVSQLSGRKFDELTVIETKRFGLPEFRFAWYQEGEDGGTFRRADLVQDGEVFYYVIFDVKEEAGGEYDRLMAQVFSTFGLSADEGF